MNSLAFWICSSRIPPILTEPIGSIHTGGNPPGTPELRIPIAGFQGDRAGLLFLSTLEATVIDITGEPQPVHILRVNSFDRLESAKLPMDSCV
jgi:hypothetical protein